MTSNEPLPDRCGAECRDGGYCENYPKGDSDRCRMHGADSDGGAPADNENAAQHYAFSDKFRSDLTDSEKQAVESLVDYLTDIDDERRVAAECAAEALMKYKRTGDVRFLREARQWMSEFNLLPNEDELNIGGDGANPLNVVVNREAYTDE